MTHSIVKLKKLINKALDIKNWDSLSKFGEGPNFVYFFFITWIIVSYIGISIYFTINNYDINNIKHVSGLANKLLSGCNIFNTFGFYCTGCGNTRFMLYMLHFKYLKALWYSPSLFYAFVVTIVSFISYLKRYICKTNEPRICLLSIPSLIIMLLLIIITCIIRNIFIFFGIYLI